ncbi:hypothetical protein [Gilvimarinus sp. 1_MG-2023]|uniref:hypothetical protein n=1 Tax=Gilvimarinus sp. 1_MG-2023 TaxID=3062638 RepID=UPI0026E2123E|nr:hypothetical protein [Gilvimarinus sp. 1_MG-2023]MDO6747809.1 hypothetical protein [Gilvimarinus sp. 1_MG-2023]
MSTAPQKHLPFAVLASTLENEAFFNTLKSYAISDDCAWAIRILRLSGDTRCLTLLEALEDTSIVNKVKGYAEPYDAELEVIVDEQSSKSI